MNERKELESSVEKKMVSLCKEHDWLCLKIQMAKGWPDRLLLSPKGEAIFVELKRPRGGRLTKLQAYTLARLTAQGFKCMVISGIVPIEALFSHEQNDATLERIRRITYESLKSEFPTIVPDDMLKENGK